MWCVWGGVGVLMWQWSHCLQENVIYIECIMRTPSPAPDQSYRHDNWVAAVHCCSDW